MATVASSPLKALPASTGVTTCAPESATSCPLVYTSPHPWFHCLPPRPNLGMSLENLRMTTNAS